MKFLVSIDYDKTSNSYSACYGDGSIVELNATNYQDAVCEADLQNNELDNIELGYN